MSDHVFDKDRFREAMGDMSIIDLSLKLGCPKSSISMYLSGQREPSKMAIQLIALNLGVNPAWLCGLDVPKYSNAKIISADEKPTTEKGDGLDSELIKRLMSLTPEEKMKVDAFVQGLLASR